jgi:hypothetical protein
MGFPGSALHNGTHFILYHHRVKQGQAEGEEEVEEHLVLARAASKDGITWKNERIWTDDEIGSSGAKKFTVAMSWDFSVLLDTHDPHAPYKLVLSTDACGEDTVLLLTSVDGFEWNSTGLCFPGYSDTIPAIYHDDEGDTYDMITRHQW